MAVLGNGGHGNGPGRLTFERLMSVVVVAVVLGIGVVAWNSGRELSALAATIQAIDQRMARIEVYMDSRLLGLPGRR